MSLEQETIAPEIDESMWVYLAAHDREDEDHASGPFAKLLTDACESFGFAVFATASNGDDSDARSPYWFDAVRHAELCVIDVGTSSAVAGAELAMACCAGRPVVVLRSRDEPLPAGLAAIAEHHAAVREIVFNDSVDCVAQLGEVFADPAWQQVVRGAAVADSI